jgi:thiosulfate reductase cytochrome b subunit
MSQPDPLRVHYGHKSWVRISHWVVTLSFFALAFSGFIILMCHPRLYWGDVGNDLTPALFELPVSRNYQHGGWEKNTSFFEGENSQVSASRTYEIFNENGWGRSLHFLAAWFLVFTGMTYLLMGVISGHFNRRLWPKEFSARMLASDLVNHIKMRVPSKAGQPYGLLQKCAYVFVIFVALPLAVITGLAMSPAITNEYPFLSGIFGGSQSARTIHFFASVVLVFFVLVHIAMVIKTGFKNQIRSMTIGK